MLFSFTFQHYTSLKCRCAIFIFENNGGGVMAFNVTFNNISVISWRSVLLVVETGENHRPVTSHFQILSHNVVSSTPRLRGIRTRNIKL